MAGLGTTEIILILIVILLLFGAKRLPDSARSLGRSLRIFKAETKGLREDLDTKDPAETRTQALPPAQSEGIVPPVSQTPPPVAQPVQPPPAAAPAPPAAEPLPPTDPNAAR